MIGLFVMRIDAKNMSQPRLGNVQSDQRTIVVEQGFRNLEVSRSEWLLPKMQAWTGEQPSGSTRVCQEMVWDPAWELGSGGLLEDCPLVSSLLTPC